MKKFIKSAVVVASMAAITSYAADGDTKLSVYGLLDMGVISVDGLGASATQKSLGIQSGIVTSSHIGVTGTSDISAGHKIGFKLEGNAGLNDGSQVNTAISGAQNALFSRESTISYTGPFGTVTAGRQKNPFAQAYIAGDARNWANIGTANILFADQSSFGGTATLKSGIGNLTGGTFTNNLIKYDTPTWKNFSATTYFSPGGYAGEFDSNTVYGTNLKYIDQKLNVVAGTRRAYDKTSSAPKIAEAEALGASYTLGQYKVGAGYGTMKNTSLSVGTANRSFSLQELTAAYTPNATWEFSVGQYVLKDKDTPANKSTINGAGAIYKLSKATSLYTQYSKAENQGTMGMAAYGFGYANINSLAVSQAMFPSVMTVAGKNQTAIAMGIQHRF